jgi:hypothetical protein
MRGYLGFLSFDIVFGLWNVTVVLIFFAFFLMAVPDFTALAAFKACAFGSAFFETSPAKKNRLDHISYHKKI